jgi:hypothetical protein
MLGKIVVVRGVPSSLIGGPAPNNVAKLSGKAGLNMTQEGIADQADTKANTVKARMRQQATAAKGLPTKESRWRVYATRRLLTQGR